MARLLAAVLGIGALLLALGGATTGFAQSSSPSPPVTAPPPGSAPGFAPPQAPVEVVPAPLPQQAAWVWRPGHWRWNGYQYIWVPGRYVRPPHPQAVWIEGHWVPRHGVWVWAPGHWR